MLLDVGKETIGTTALDAAPDMILEMPEDTYAPLLLTLGIACLFAGLIAQGVVARGQRRTVLAGSRRCWCGCGRGATLREREPPHG